jgi:predicted nucleic acid-binding protein
MEEQSQVENLVVDASVVVKWYVMEDHREQALKLRDDYVEGRFTLIAPSLMPYEVLNAVRRAKKDISIETLVTVAESLTLYGIMLHELRGELANLTVKTAIENEVSVYDAAYIALAKLSGTTLYTADERLKESLTRAYQKYVAHIKDYRRVRES